MSYNLHGIRPIGLLFAIVLIVVITANIKNSARGESFSQPQNNADQPAIYLPIVQIPYPLPEAWSPPIAHEGTPPLDFETIRHDLRSDEQELAYNKIGFHVGPGGNRIGIEDWLSALDQAGIPVFYKSVDDAEPLFKAQELTKVSSVPHTLVYRVTTHGQNDGYHYDVPNYALEPAVAAAVHWQKHLDKFPPELDPEYIWLETINEVDRNRSEWLGEFALETAELALRDGYRWAAFGWSSGEPESADWESPAMLEFLELAGQHPDQLAVALHEYSYSATDITEGYPYLIGRFQELFRICDKHGIPRPTVLITEWGWTYKIVPDVDQAMADISWASWIYSAFPQIRGAAIWYLGPGFLNIADKAQKLIAPVTEYSLSNYFAIAPIEGEIDPDIFAPPTTSATVND